MARRPLNFDPALLQDLKAQSKELWESPLQSRTRLSPPIEKDEMIQLLLQVVQQPRDYLVEDPERGTK